MHDLNLSVPDISCAHCKASVENAIAGVDPGARVVVDLAARRVHVETMAAPDRVLEALDEAGFPAHIPD